MDGHLAHVAGPAYRTENASTNKADLPSVIVSQSRTRWLRRVGDRTHERTRDAGVVNNRAARHGRGRPTPAAPLIVDELDGFDDHEPRYEPLYVFVNYQRSPLGTWTAALTPGGLEPVTLQATSAHDAHHKAMDFIDALSDYADVAISTMHTIDGDPAAWTTLAAREDFLDCAITDHTLADLVSN